MFCICVGEGNGNELGYEMKEAKANLIVQRTGTLQRCTTTNCDYIRKAKGSESKRHGGTFVALSWADQI